MYYATIDDKISSAHQLREYQGKCERLHGHNWTIRVTVSGNELDKCGMLIDFGILKQRLKNILEILDHRFINEVPPFDKINPSAENIAEYIFVSMKDKLTDYDLLHNFGLSNNCYDLINAAYNKKVPIAVTPIYSWPSLRFAMRSGIDLLYAALIKS